MASTEPQQGAPEGSQALHDVLLEIDLAHEEMKRVRTAYIHAMKVANGRHGAWSERNTLGIYIRRVGNSLQTRWGRVAWKGARGKKIYKVLAAGARGDVSDKMLAKYAQPWALPLVLAAEYRLRILRRRAAMANKAVYYIKQYEKTHEEYATVKEKVDAMRDAISDDAQDGRDADMVEAAR